MFRTDWRSYSSKFVRNFGSYLISLSFIKFYTYCDSILIPYSPKNTPTLTIEEKQPRIRQSSLQSGQLDSLP